MAHTDMHRLPDRMIAMDDDASDVAIRTFTGGVVG
jgi:hypothetical protein